MRLQAGYQADLSKENTPQECFVGRNSRAGYNLVEDRLYYNRFIYKNDIHALYATLSYNSGKFGLMAGLRGEYWKVNTETYSWRRNTMQVCATSRSRKITSNFSKVSS